MSSSSPAAMIIIGSLGLGLALLIFMKKPGKLSQSDQFKEDLRNLNKIPISSYDPMHTPAPGQTGWEFNYNRS